MTIHTVPMPRRLGKGKYYTPSCKRYCAVGWLNRHLRDVGPKDYSYQAMNFTPGSYLEDFLGGVSLADMIRANDDAPNEKARLAAFRVSCAELNIAIEENR